MKVFVTVGTTKFDAMIKALDELFAQKAFSHHEVLFQIADGVYVPKSNTYVTMLSTIEEAYREHDLVITHAGAGSIFRLLELRKKIIIIPNVDRIDTHQTDIAKYMGDNQHALICDDLSALGENISQSSTFKYIPYLKEGFFKADEIADFIIN
ncbi:hypothetical protein GCM10007916_00920 [Psychromonas marina]|uniref:Glycosyl transferase family 28 C-terminal domain-containing protein n=1 Tax=Psychromonas marina TaxID=88364 RepID=A0ABQ6DVL8_9GAMM|nr:PssE/Cps14G family polysaccharide biosynthesis glycosyltransferase [Psychromonas marina]GLS89025.1 hypothetical protein GCM10007916_00920 [Psychromonas marina]